VKPDLTRGALHRALRAVRRISANGMLNYSLTLGGS